MEEMTVPEKNRAVALAIAGFDPSSGAGITADLKTFAAHDVYGMACISALTVQSTLGVKRVEPVSPKTIRETLACLCEDVQPDGVKIGMLATAEAVKAVADFLADSKISLGQVVLDPVLRSSSGRELLSAGGTAILRKSLLGLVGWVTPNLDELAVLAGVERVQRGEVPGAAAHLQEIAKRVGNPGLHVLVTGGHLERPDDFLRTPSGEEFWLAGERVDTTSTHGTGCAFSSALLSGILQGKSPQQAAEAAKQYVMQALRAAYPMGRGRGPMHHLFRLG